MRDDGGPRIQEVAEVDHSFDAAKLRQRAELIDWPGKRLIEALTTGVADHSGGTPKLCVVTRPGKGVALHEAELEEKLDAEVAKGFLRGAREPRACPWCGEVWGSS